jgi:hypothetical protein
MELKQFPISTSTIFSLQTNNRRAQLTPGKIGLNHLELNPCASPNPTSAIVSTATENENNRMIVQVSKKNPDISRSRVCVTDSADEALQPPPSIIHYFYPGKNHG